jgi:hypothetical protein
VPEILGSIDGIRGTANNGRYPIMCSLDQPDSAEEQKFMMTAPGQKNGAATMRVTP